MRGHGVQRGRGHGSQRTVHRPNATQATLSRVHAFWRGEPVETTLQLCLNRCRRARNGVCDDHDACREGMDCNDCGVRVYRPPAPGRAGPRRRNAWRHWVSPLDLSAVSLCTLMTADRVPSLHRLASSWAHLLSVAYLADDFEVDAARGFGMLRLDGRSVPHAELLTLSIVEDRGYRSPANRFPFNLLRNVAVSAAAADFVCLVDVDFVAYPQPMPGCAECHAAARLSRWVPLLRMAPHLALVLPAFDAVVGSGTAMGAVRNKRDVAQAVRTGAAEAFAFTQYPLGHACDNSSRWLASRAPYAMRYSFGCEPYLVYNRRSAPKLWEMFVAYGKDRVSFTYELVARGFVMVVQPEERSCHMHMYMCHACAPVHQCVHARTFSAHMLAKSLGRPIMTTRSRAGFSGAPHNACSGWQLRACATRMDGA